MDGIEVNTTAELREPAVCTEDERRAFARLVREGFDGSDEGLDDRVRHAQCLAFRHTADGVLVAIAGLKVPAQRVRNDVFAKAGAPVRPADYRLELGWVFVIPAHRGRRIGEDLCRRLLARVPTSCVFATTRPDNTAMMKILRALGFARVGGPFARHTEQLILFLRPYPPLAVSLDDGGTP